MEKYLSLFFSIALYNLTLGQSTSDGGEKLITIDTAQVVKTDEIKEDVSNDTLCTPLEVKWKPYKKSVYASYYANKFNGRRTASGKRFSNNSYTAAHKKLPFGTLIRVTNENSGKSVILEVTDRGPFVRSREVDLTKRSFMEIVENKMSGIMKVTIEIGE